MYEGKPLVLVIGSTSTGRTPIAAGLLRHALGAGVVVRTAGVLAHDGEGAAPEAQMAMEQLGIDISRHLSRPLDPQDHRNAELLLAVDRGTELVLFTEFRNDSRIACLSTLANLPDVLDPHRMPLGVWVASVRQLHDQVTKAVPIIRERLGIAGQEPLPFPKRKVERRKQNEPKPFVLGTGARVQWDDDEEMQRLLRLIEQGQSVEEPGLDVITAEQSDAVQNGTGDLLTSTQVEVDLPEANAETSSIADGALAEQPTIGSTSSAVPAVDQVLSEPEPSQLDVPAAATPEPVVAHTEAPAEPMVADAPTTLNTADSGTRVEHVTRMTRLLEMAGQAPEIVDWERLRGELVNRLRAVAQQGTGAMDFAPAATLMIEGKLVQLAVQPPAEALQLLRRSIERLAAPLKPAELATIGAELGQW